MERNINKARAYFQFPIWTVLTGCLVWMKTSLRCSLTSRTIVQFLYFSIKNKNRMSMMLQRLDKRKNRQTFPHQWGWQHVAGLLNPAPMWFPLRNIRNRIRDISITDHQIEATGIASFFSWHFLFPGPETEFSFGCVIDYCWRPNLED